MALRFNIPLIFYGEMPGEYGESISHKTSSYAKTQGEAEAEGYSLDYTTGKDVRDVLLGGKSIGEYLDEGMLLVELMSYLPAPVEQLHKRNIEFKYLGYYKKWVPQEAYYYVVENTGSKKPRPHRGHLLQIQQPRRQGGRLLLFHTLDQVRRWPTMMDWLRRSELPHHKGRRAGVDLKYEGEYPERYEKEFLDYVSLTREEFLEVCDRFRSPHLWKVENGSWQLRHRP